MAFKLGDEGLVYYRDGVPVHISVQREVRPMHGTPPVALAIDELIPAAPGLLGPGSRLPHTPRAAPNRSRKKRKKKANARAGPEALRPTKRVDSGTLLCCGGGRLDLDPQCPTWPDDGSLAAGCEQHRRQGLWAIETLNPDCWPSALEYLKMTTADVALIQECKTVGGSATDEAEAAVRHAKWNVSIQPCRITDLNGKSAGAAVGCRSHIGMSNGAAMLEDVQKLQTGRFQLRKVVCIAKGGVHCGTPYLHSGIGVQAKSNLDLLHLMAAALAAVTGPWILGGDWNCTPAELEATGWLSVVGGKTFAPKSDTCGKRVIDYFVVSLNLAHAVRSVHCIGDALFTTHSRVRLLLEANPRAATIRTLKSPARFNAVLPYGPPNRTSHATTGNCKGGADADTTGGTEAITSPEALDMACTRFLNDAEAELSALCSHDAATAAKLAGRASGPGFVWKPACGPPAADLCRTTMVSRAWRRTAGWFRTLRASTMQKKVAAARWKILH